MNLVKVQGQGRASAAPDLALLGLSVESRHSRYATCLEDLNRRTESLRAAVKRVSPAGTTLKTTDFRVRTETRHVDGRSRFEGYLASHRLSIELPMDTRLLDEVLVAITNGSAGAEVALTFTVKDRESLRQQAMADAVRVARENALTLAGAAGVELLELQHIEYGWSEIRIHEQDICLSALETSMSGPCADIDPEDVSIEESVLLVYALDTGPRVEY